MSSRQRELNPARLRVVLVLQGGGALGAYQAGVFQAMHEHGLAPDWVVGTSIGAINAAIVAGNPHATRLDKLKQFWDSVAHRDSYDMSQVPDWQRRSNVLWQTWDTVLRGVPGFFKPRMSLFAAGAAVDPEQASYYDTTELGTTLNQLIDFDYLNQPGGMRLTVNALKVTCGTLRSFDNRKQTLHADHVRASGALPPGFAPVRIDGDLYWDGGLYSNTPLETVLDDTERVDTLCFMVDLWSADGPEPATLEAVQTRQKDVTFASRSQRQLQDYVATHQLKQKIRALYAQVPTLAGSTQGVQDLADLGGDSTLHVVRVAYAGRDWNMAAKDINFSQGSIHWRWEQGYQDGLRAIAAAGWLSVVPGDTPLVVHELAPLYQPARGRQG